MAKNRGNFMGILLLLVFVPTYIVMCILSIVLGNKNLKEYQSMPTFIIIGISLGLIFTLISVWLFTFIEFREYEGVFILTAVTVFAPIILAIIIRSFIAPTPSIRIRSLLSGILFSTVFSPWATLSAGIAYEKNISYLLFPSVCKNAEIEILEDVTGVKNVVFLEDSFAIYNEHKGIKFKSQAKYLLSKSMLEYIEIPNKSGRSFEQIRFKGKRSPMIMYDSGNYEDLEILLIDSPTSDYEVTSERLRLSNAHRWKIYGSRIEIRRVVDGKLIAYAQYYWDKSKNKMCPNEAMDNVFVYKFIAKSLRVDHPENKL